jgi:hypothetical protein
MPAFDAGAVVEALEWDFTGKQGTKTVPGWPRGLANARGVISEPTDAAIGRFLDGLKKLYSEAQKTLTADLPEDATPDQMLEALSSVTGDAFVQLMADIAALFAELCGGSPSKDQLLLLPMRARVRFFAWVQQEVVSPEAGPGAGTAVVRSLPSAAAG